MFWALSILGLVAGTWAVGEAFGTWDDDDDDTSQTTPPEEETPPDLILTGTEDAFELLQGGDGNDAIGGNYDEIDTLSGEAGDDTLILSLHNTGIGGAGDDTFRIEGESTIRDFTPGEDHLEILSPTPAGTTPAAAGESYLWIPDTGSVALYRVDDATGEALHLARLEGLTSAPPPEDLTLIQQDSDGTETRIAGADVPFRTTPVDIDFTGDSSDESMVFSGNFSNLVADMGAGDDTVTSEVGIARVDLGDGNDVYRSSMPNPLINMPPYLVQETVQGGAGDDSFTPGALHLSRFEGGAGDDTFNLNEYTDAGLAEALGGAGEDSFFIDMNAVVTGGEGADTFTARNAYASTTITDFDPSEDVLAIAVSPAYSGAGNITLRANADTTTTVQLDGRSFVTIEGALADTTGIVLITDPSATL